MEILEIYGKVRYYHGHVDGYNVGNDADCCEGDTPEILLYWLKKATLHTGNDYDNIRKEIGKLITDLSYPFDSDLLYEVEKDLENLILAE